MTTPAEVDALIARLSASPYGLNIDDLYCTIRKEDALAAAAALAAQAQRIAEQDKQLLEWRSIARDHEREREKAEAALAEIRNQW